MSVKEPYATQWKEKVLTRIRRSHGVLVLVSKNSFDSSGQKWEIQCAKEEGKPIRGTWPIATIGRRLPVPRPSPWAAPITTGSSTRPAAGVTKGTDSGV